MAYGLAVAVAGTPAAPDSDGSSVATASVGLSLLMMPAAFVSAAFISRRNDAPLAVLAAMGLALAVGLPLLVFGNPIAALIAGYAAGAVVTMHLPEGITWHYRAIAAAVVTVVSLAGMTVAFLATATIAAALPFTATAVADHYATRRQA